MAFLFRCEPTDVFVRKYPGAAGKIVAHQDADSNYLFEVHEGHETGNPIYIRLTSDGDVDTSNSNVTKFDTKNKTAVELVNEGRLTNKKQNTLGARLNTVELAELKSFCLTNFAFFKTLGEDYYVKKVEPKDSDKLVDQTGTPPGKRGAKPKKKGNK